MKKSFLQLIIFLLLGISSSLHVFSQGVAININGTPADNSAMLDISSTNKGTLLTRLTTAQRDSIVSPAEGLLIFNKSTKCFEFFAGGMWVTLSCGCTPPVAAGTIIGSATVCKNENGVNFYVPPIANATGYIWVLPAGASIATGINTNSISVNFSSTAISGDITVYGTSTSCGNGAVSAIFPVTVNDVPTGVTASPSSTDLCEGSNLTLTGSASNAVSWSWTGPNSFSSNQQSPIINNINNAASGTYTLTASNSCGSATAVNTPIITVNTNLPASVSITAAPSHDICNGQSVNFSAIPVNGGQTPTYQWTLNGNNVGTNSSTYTNATLSDGDVIQCTMTSSACATGSPANSNMVTMTVSPNLPASVSISASSNPICTGNPVSFIASPVNGGPTPSYQWQVNGSNVGNNSNTYSASTINNGDQVSCIMTSSICATGSPATSNTINMTVNSNPLGPLNIPSTYNGKQAFAYTNNDQSFVVPACVTQIYVKMWAAGGGGGNDGNTYGGAGAYVSGYLNVTPGSTLKVIVGGGGVHANSSAAPPSSYGGGGSGGASSGGYKSASGGGRSAIQFISGTDIVTAGGGGGSGGIGWNNQRPYGGGGGATTGSDGGDGYNSGVGPGSGHGGSISSGGAPSTGGVTQSSAGIYLTGSAGASSTYGGGGGGGGYYGGSGGSGTINPGNIGGGGGGSSYINNLTSAVNLPGSSGQYGGPWTAPNNSDIDFVSGIGTGANVGQNGGNGRVIIYW